MLGYLAILGAALCGLAHLQPWTIGFAAIALLALSQAKDGRALTRAQDTSLIGLQDRALLRLVVNAFAAAAVAYGGGWIISLL